MRLHVGFVSRDGSFPVEWNIVRIHALIFTQITNISPNVGGPVGLADLYVDKALVRYMMLTRNNLTLQVRVGVCYGYLFQVSSNLDLTDTDNVNWIAGWNAWYNWTIVLPAELSAAAVIASAYVPDTGNYQDHVYKLNIATTIVLVSHLVVLMLRFLTEIGRNWYRSQLVLAVTINFFGRYGEFESWFAMIKIGTIIVLSKWCSPPSEEGLTCDLNWL